MFPCKLFEIFLSPYPNTIQSQSIFVESLTLDKNSFIEELLEQDNKVLITETPIPLIDVLHQYFLHENSREAFLLLLTSYINKPQLLQWQIQERIKQSHSIQDEYLLLQLVSSIFKIKITIYEVLYEELDTRIINFGHKTNLFLAKLGDGYCLVGFIGQQTSKTVINQVKLIDQIINTDVSTFFKSDFVSNSEGKARIIQSDNDGETIKLDFAKCINENSTTNSLSEQCQEDPQTPPNNSTRYTTQLSNSEPALNHSDLIQELNIHQGMNCAPRFTGNLKFYDDKKKYGFIVMDNDGSDIFVHSDDLVKAGVTKEILISVKQGLIIKFSYSCLSYVGKYNKSRKAVDLKLQVSRNNELGFQYVLKNADTQYLFNQFSNQLQYNYNYNL